MTVQAVDTGEWVSVSEMARLEGVSTQMIYIRIRDGVYDVQAFTRGTMNGYLVRKKSGKDGKQVSKVLQDAPRGTGEEEEV